MNIAGIKTLYFAAGMDQAGAALGDLPEKARFPVDVSRLIRECSRPVAERLMPSEQHMSQQAAEVLHAWARAAHTKV